MPEVNEITYIWDDKQHRRRKRIWKPCDICGEGAWILPGIKSRLCRKCASKKYNPNTGNFCEEHNQWKGGRFKSQLGYILVQLKPDDFFISMVNCHRYVPEHRLIMAKHLGRCLLSWEVVHHKNGVKDDNRLENLQLISDKRFHLVDARVKAYIRRLEKKIVSLEIQLKDAKCHSKLHNLKEAENDIAL